MPARQKVSNEDIIAAYLETPNIVTVGKRFGMRPSSAHERLIRLGVMRPQNILSSVEEDRLRSEYWIAAATGKLAELAEDMGRDKTYLCKHARRLGLTDTKRPRTWLAVWKYVSEESARIFFEQFKASSLNLGQYCRSKGYDDLGFARCMKEHFPDEWEHVIEAKQIGQTKYKSGRMFEYQVRDYLKSLGFVAMRSPASKSPIDIIAVRPGQVIFVQCKRHGILNPKGWNDLFDLADSAGALAILAFKGGGRKGHQYKRLTARKEGRAPQPYVDWDPTAKFATLRVAAGLLP